VLSDVSKKLFDGDRDGTQGKHSVKVGNGNQDDVTVLLKVYDFVYFDFHLIRNTANCKDLRITVQILSFKCRTTIYSGQYSIYICQCHVKAGRKYFLPG